jgi:hypothetical protein
MTVRYILLKLLTGTPFPKTVPKRKRGINYLQGPEKLFIGLES